MCMRCRYECLTLSFQESLKTFRCDDKAGVYAGLFLILSSSFLCSSLLAFPPCVDVTVFPPWLGAFHFPDLGPLLGFTDGYKTIYKMFTKHVQQLQVLKYQNFGNNVFRAHLLLTGAPRITFISFAGSFNFALQHKYSVCF